MPIFYKDSLKVLFVHIPKAAGSSVTSFFMRSGYELSYLDTGNLSSKLNKNRLMSPQHMHSNPLREIFKLNTFDLIFSITRHPVERLLSEYKMRVGDMQNHKKFIPPSPDEWIQNYFELFEKDNYILDNHLRPQYEFEVDNHVFFKIEDGLDKEWSKKISDLLGDKSLSEKPISTSNKSREPSQSLKVSKETLQLIKNFYKRDFVRFDYS